MTVTTTRLASASRPDPNPLAGPAGRLFALSGLAGALFYAIGSLLPGSAPKPDATTTLVVDYFADKRGALLGGFALELIALALLLCFLGQLHTLISTAAPTCQPFATTMAAGWVVLSTVVATTTLPGLAIVWRGAATTSPEIVRLAVDMQTLGTYAASSTAALLTIAVPSIVIWRYHTLPFWLAVLGAAEVLANVVELAGLSARHGPLAGGYIYGVGEILWLIWVAGASVTMAIRSRPSQNVLTGTRPQ